MIRLIITENDKLYDGLSANARAEGDTPQRAVNVVEGFRQATALAENSGTRPVRRLSAIVVDMSLHTADTLVEALHSRQITAHVPLLVVKCDAQLLPVALRRLCTDILDADTLCPPDESSHSTGKSAKALG
jgi:hypothetical protein